MTYRELATAILQMDEIQLDSDVVVHLKIIDEYTLIEGMNTFESANEDVLDNGHPVIVVIGY